MPQAWADLLAAIASEQEPPLAAATAVHLLARVPPEMRNAVVGVLADRHGSDFAALRSRELGILDSLSGGRYDVGDVRENLDSWSAWLQLRAAGEETDQGILAELARSGRTRRIRLTASERLRLPTRVRLQVVRVPRATLERGPGHTEHGQQRRRRRPGNPNPVRHLRRT
jgi:hypothetical protein